MKICRPSFSSSDGTFSDIRASINAGFSHVKGGFDTNLGAGASSGAGTDMHTLLNQSNLNFWGGKSDLHNKETLKKEDLMSKWKLSCRTEPVMLDTEMSLEPISTVIALVDKQKDTSSYKVLKIYLPSFTDRLYKQENIQGASHKKYHLFFRTVAPNILELG